MTDLTRRTRGGAVVVAEYVDAPLLSSVIERALDVAKNPVIDKGALGSHDPGYRQAPVLLSLDQWRAALEAAAQFDRLPSKTVSEGHLAAWLAPLNAGSRNPQGPNEFRSKVAAMAMLLGDLPEAAFTIESMRLVDAGGFFPSHADIRAVIGPIAAAWAEKRDGLLRLQYRSEEPEPAARVGRPTSIGEVTRQVARDAAKVRRGPDGEGTT